ncbi:hypothetical protein RP20_CCG006380 [Aedes albopictus]|nr:hypothetical protein RP20_CCG006380 [Aedes albopictus]
MCLTNDITFKETFCPNEIQERELTDVSIKVEFGEEELVDAHDLHSLNNSETPAEQGGIYEVPLIDTNQAKVQYVGIHDQIQKNQNEQIREDNLTVKESDSSEDDYEMHNMENALLIDSGVKSNGTNSTANATKPDRKTVPLYEGRFMCNVCEKQVTKLHHSTHKGQQLFECYICKNTFRKFANLSRHIHNHIRKEKYHHKDSTTGNDHQEAGPSSSNQEAVRNGADILMDRDYECKMCNKTVSSLHALNHKPQGFRCPICESLFQRFDCFGRHVRCHKSKGKYACDICSMRFPSTYRMGRHRRLHFGNKS